MKGNNKKRGILIIEHRLSSSKRFVKSIGIVLKKTSSKLTLVHNLSFESKQPLDIIKISLNNIIKSESFPSGKVKEINSLNDLLSLK